MILSPTLIGSPKQVPILWREKENVQCYFTKVASIGFIVIVFFFSFSSLHEQFRLCEQKIKISPIFIFFHKLSILQWTIHIMDAWLTYWIPFLLLLGLYLYLLYEFFIYLWICTFAKRKKTHSTILSWRELGHSFWILEGLTLDVYSVTWSCLGILVFWN